MNFDWMIFLSTRAWFTCDSASSPLSWLVWWFMTKKFARSFIISMHSSLKWAPAEVIQSNLPSAEPVGRVFNQTRVIALYKQRHLHKQEDFRLKQAGYFSPTSYRLSIPPLMFSYHGQEVAKRAQLIFHSRLRDDLKTSLYVIAAHSSE